MSVEPIESMSDDWVRWEGHAINGAFPLHRYLGCSGHSGVFLTEFAARQLPEVAIKLIPVDPDRMESRLSRLRTAASLTHRHLIRLLEIGRCYLDGEPHLYAVMEYADQTLAQLLTHRALSESEAREMLLPTLDALLFLHNRNLVQGQLKPANVLVVGDQLKLASDTIVRVGEDAAYSDVPSVYDPPEARHACRYTAGDIWALGVTLVEALTRSPPPGFDEHGEEVGLRPDFSAAFREIVTKCLSVRPSERPNVKELVAWLRAQSGGSAPGAPVQPTAGVPPAVSEQPAASDRPVENEQPVESVQPTESHQPAEGGQPAESEQPPESGQPGEIGQPAEGAQSAASEQPVESEQPAERERSAVSELLLAMDELLAVTERPAAVSVPERTTRERPPALRLTLQQLVRDATARAAHLLQYLNQQSVLPLALGAVAIFVVGWLGVRVFTTHHKSSPPTVSIAPDARPQTPPAAAPGVSGGPPPVVSALVPSSGSVRRSGQTDAAAPRAVLHEVIPDVPLRARRTIRGHIKVYIRVIVDKDGTVFAALADRPGPSRYFERLAMQSAKKWSFSPVDSPNQRLMQVRFDFSRGGTSGRAVPLH